MSTFRWDFTEPQFYPIFIDKIKVNVVLSPYTPEELKAVLKKAIAGYKRDKKEIEIVREDRSVYTPLFDAHFVRITDTNSDDTAQQRKFFDDRPELKAAIVEATFGGVASEAPEDEETSKVLDLFAAPESSIKVFQHLYDPSADDVVKVTMEHTYQTPTEAQFRTYRNSRRSRIGGSRNAMVTVQENYESLEKLYDTVVISISNAAASGQPCDQKSKAQWVSKVPLWHKLHVCDQIFSEVIEKND